MVTQEYNKREGPPEEQKPRMPAGDCEGVPNNPDMCSCTHHNHAGKSTMHNVTFTCSVPSGHLEVLPMPSTESVESNTVGDD